MLELAKCLRLDLADALAGHRELLADFFQRMVGVHADAEAHPQDAFFARRQRGQNPGCRFAQIGLKRRIDRQDRILVPQSLRHYADLSKEIVLVGVLEYFEIWARQKWEQENVDFEKDFKKEEVRNEIAKLGL